MRITHTALMALANQPDDGGRTVLMEADGRFVMATPSQALDKPGVILAYKWQIMDAMATGLSKSGAATLLARELNQ